MPVTPPACSRCGQYVCQCTQGPNPPETTMSEHDELLARAAKQIIYAWDHNLNIDEVDIKALRSALAARPQPDEPTALDMVTELHRAIYGDTWARPESPQQVWEMLLTRVSGLAQGWCGECERRAAGQGDLVLAAAESDVEALRAALAARPNPTSPDRNHRRSPTMPVNDRDELLARTDYWLKWSAIGGETFELIRGLRAALAARPQADAIIRDLADCSPEQSVMTAGLRDRARRAVPGSATPTGDDDD